MMKTKFRLAGIFILLAATSPDAFAQPGRTFVPGELLVKFKDGSDAAVGGQALVSNRIASRARTMRKLGRGNSPYRVGLRAGDNVLSAVKDFERDPSVEYAQPNYIYRAHAVPNDPSYGQLWGLKNTGQTITSDAGYASTPTSTNNPGTAGKDQGMEAAWDRITDCSSVTVAVLDTGINYNHADLAGNLWNGGVTYPNHGYDFIDNDTDPMDTNGHGTHVAGTIGAVGNNGIGATGVCWTASLMAVRVLDTTGSGTSAGILSGLDFAVDQGAKVVNLSLGGGSYDPAFSTALTRAANAGVTVVVAAGNSGTNNETSPVYPCNYTHSNLICVAALDQKYSLAWFSNYGSTSVDVGAPGVNVVSLWPGTQTSVTDDFTLGWTYGSAGGSTWSAGPQTVGGSTEDMLFIPTTWGSSSTYANNSNSTVYKSFDLSGADAVEFSFDGIVDTESAKDFFKVAMDATGADPFAGGGTVLETWSGSTSDFAFPFYYDISSCTVMTCALGFQLVSDSAGVDFGAGLLNFVLRKLALNTTSYNVASGTSMATPHVAGMAAMVMVHNPAYQAADVVRALKNGGIAVSALSGKTSSGKAVSAMGSLDYISPPSSVTAVVQ